MAFEALREQLREQAAEAVAKIQETSAFNTLREKYESQSAPVQKALVLGGLALMILFFLSFPMSYISSSSESLARFEENRELIQGLLRASRTAKQPPPLPPPMSADTIRSSVDSVLKQNGLLPTQIGEMNAIPDPELKGLAPPGVIVSGVAVQLKKLNVSQLIDLGNLVQNLGPGVKLLGTDIVQSSGTTHYYDLILRVVSFGLPAIELNESDAGPKGKLPMPKKKAKSNDEMEGE